MTTFLQALSNAGPSLVAALEVGVRHAMLQAYARASPKKPDEPDFVAAILVDAVPIFASHLNAVCIAAGGAAKLTGMFCHGRPEVEHGGGRCELGDILFAHFHTDAAGLTRRTSLLLQVKMSASPLYVVPGREQIQLQLYSAWPIFEYARTSVLNGLKRNVLPKASHRGAQYLLLDNGAPSNPATGLIGPGAATPALLATPGATLHATDKLSIALVELLMGLNGREFSDQATAGNDWSAVVWDLLQYGATHTFNRKQKSGFLNRPRSVSAMTSQPEAFFVRAGGQGADSKFLTTLYGAYAGMALDRWLDGGGEGQPPDQLDIGDSGGDGGLGLVVIETSEGAEERQKDSNWQ